MAERKVLIKYYPKNFDYRKIPKVKLVENKQHKVRMMMPMTVVCNNCNERIGVGKKFNSRKETIKGETYCGIRIFRFYLRCPQCSSEVTIKTDPEHLDYLPEFGCKRAWEPWKFHKEKQLELDKKKEEEEEGDIMRTLENRTKESKREMDILESLDEIRAINDEHNKLDLDQMLFLLNQKFENFGTSLPKKELDIIDKIDFQKIPKYINNRTELGTSLFKQFSKKRKQNDNEKNPENTTQKENQNNKNETENENKTENEEGNKTKNDQKPKNQNTFQLFGATITTKKVGESKNEKDKKKKKKDLKNLRKRQVSLCFYSDTESDSESGSNSESGNESD
ncbi:splicing factor yju2 [Anaeramoeba flamelloides]|uniref:Splicing factor YJU2 n=1 Tax=Anaeramoeba flamelloides TaxID=1746091 RepID=A0ABQ8YHT8_9EUKA|nr:splicing factor yju2 [Anaeramoeba flamelloides]